MSDQEIPVALQCRKCGGVMGIKGHDTWPEYCPFCGFPPNTIPQPPQTKV